MPWAVTTYAGAGYDTLYGDAYSMDGTASGGKDILNGGTGDNILFGDAYSMDGTARGGEDQLNGGDGNDTLYGDALVFAQAASDALPPSIALSAIEPHPAAI